MKEKKLNINNDKPCLNRGVELVLNGGRKKQTKTFKFIFEKIVCLFRREVTIHLEFSLNCIRKR
jgi:uncharacterized protein Veg